MKKTLFFIVLNFCWANFVWGQTQESLSEIPADPPLTIGEIRNDARFMRLIQQMPGSLKLSQEPSNPSNVVGVVDWPEPSQTPSPLLTSIVVQTLAEIDSFKGMLLQDLRNAETPGYRAMKVMPNAEVFGRGFDYQTDFQSRRYVPSRSKFDWAIHGEGFFVLRKLDEPFNKGRSESPDCIETLYASYSDNIDAIYYTRAGRFELTDDNKLCLKRYGEIYLLQPEQDISLWFGNKELVEENGLWSIIANFDHPERLPRIDGVLFQAEPDGEKPKPTEPFRANLRSQEYEASNVDVAETLQLYRALHRLQSAMLEQLSY